VALTPRHRAGPDSLPARLIIAREHRMTAWDNAVAELGRLAEGVGPIVARARDDALDQAAAAIAPHLDVLRSIVGNSSTPDTATQTGEIPPPMTNAPGSLFTSPDTAV
jgi:ABC-type transporter Mla subunit MlaD